MTALFLISAYFISQADGNSAAPAVKTLALTLQLAYDIGLDRDPDELAETFTVVQGDFGCLCRDCPVARLTDVERL